MNSNENLYEKRKKETPRGEDKSIQFHGIEFIDNDPLISPIFEDKQFPKEIYTVYNVERVKRSYIYVISKKIDNRTFIKIGTSQMGSGTFQNKSNRLTSAQTFLIPGLKNIGFKLHYLFIYRREVENSGKGYGWSIEQELHKELKTKFEKAVIHLPSNTPSEWYLPSRNNYHEFFDFMLRFISVQMPEPTEAYFFKLEDGKKTRVYKDQFMPTVSKEDILNYRKKDFVERKKREKALAIVTEQQKLSRKGSKAYFMEKLVYSVKKTKPPLGISMKVSDIYYHNKSTDNIRKNGEYYAYIENVPPSEREPNMTMTFTTELNKVKKYFTHISNVLQYMNDINTLDHYNMRTNFNYYHTKPITQAKVVLSRISDEPLEMTPAQCQWLIGRIVRDKSNTLYKAIKFKKTKKNKVDKVIFREIDGNTFQIKEDSVEKKAEVVVAYQLAVDYFENILHTGIKYNIDDKNFKQNLVKTKTKYDIWDFVKVNANYFTTGGQPDPKEHICLILQKKWDYQYDKDIKKTVYEHQYEVLFDDNSVWTFKVENLERVSRIVTNKREKTRFLNSANKKKNVLYHVYDYHGLPRPDVKEADMVMKVAAVPKRKKRKMTIKKAPSRTSNRTRKISYNLRTRN